MPSLVLCAHLEWNWKESILIKSNCISASFFLRSVCLSFGRLAKRRAISGWLIQKKTTTIMMMVMSEMKVRLAKLNECFAYNLIFVKCKICQELFNLLTYIDNNVEKTDKTVDNKSNYCWNNVTIYIFCIYFTLFIVWCCVFQIGQSTGTHNLSNSMDYNRRYEIERELSLKIGFSISFALSYEFCRRHFVGVLWAQVHVYHHDQCTYENNTCHIDSVKRNSLSLSRSRLVSIKCKVKRKKSFTIHKYAAIEIESTL